MLTSAAVTETNVATLDARLYERLHTGNEGDVAFYAEACLDARTVLELGCGSGRILTALVAPQRTLVGVDRSAIRLAMARERLDDAVTLLEGDVSAPPIDGRFERILLPYNVLYALPSEAAQLACLRWAAAHLTDDGRVVLDGYAVLEDELSDLEGPDDFELLTRITDGDDVWTVYERNEDGDGPGHLSVTYRFEGADGTITQRLEHRIVSVERMPALLREAGLAIVARYGSFESEPFSDESEFHIVEAERAP